MEADYLYYLINLAIHLMIVISYLAISLLIDKSSFRSFEQLNSTSDDSDIDKAALNELIDEMKEKEKENGNKKMNLGISEKEEEKAATHNKLLQW